MSQYANLKAAIAANVYENHNNQVTANMVKAAMNAMVDSLGAGYQYLGIATPTSPGTAQTPDQKVFYIATTPGTYTYLGGLVVNDGEVAILKWDTAWHKEVTGAATAAQVTELGQKYVSPLVNDGIPFMQGNLNADGTVDTSIASRLVTADFIERGAVGKYITPITGYKFYRICEYDSNKDFITAISGGSTTFGTDTLNCSYIKFSIEKTPADYLPLDPLGEYVRCILSPWDRDSIAQTLYVGYRDATLHSTTNRVSTFYLNCVNRDLKIYSLGNILICGKITFDSDKNFVSSDLTISATELTLSAGNYYQVLFKKSDNSSITLNDVYTNIIIEDDGMYSYINHINAGFLAEIDALDSRVGIVEQKATLKTLTKSNSDFTGDRWFTGNVGDVITENSGGAYASTYSIKLPVEANHKQYNVSGKGTGAPLWATIDANNIIKRRSGNNMTSDVLSPESGEVYLIVQTNNASTNPGSVVITLNSLENRVEELDAFPRNNFKGASRFAETNLAKLLAIDSGFVNIGFLGDSWTQGTENVIGGVTSGFAGYVEVVAERMWGKFGFGGLGWLDFGFDNGDKGRKMFGCADLYKHWSYSVTGDVSGLDGSTGSAAQCLGICCAHTVFDKDSVLSLTFDAGKLDKFKIRYYKDAHFSVSVNGGAATEITANSNDGWQETELGTTGTDTTSVVITSLADGSIIFGMDCFYGTKGVRIHKIGNRSIAAASYLAQDAGQWEEGIGLLGLCSLSLLFGINDLGRAGKNLDVVLAIVTTINNLIERAKVSYTKSVGGNDLITCDFNVLAIDKIEWTSREGLAMLAERYKLYALEKKYGYVCTKDSIGDDRDEMIYSGIFSDMIHLNAIGSKAFGENICNSLFEF